MSRADRRRQARSAACGLCFERMTHHDRVDHHLAAPDGSGRKVVAHKGCAAQDAQRRARAAEATVARMSQAARQVQATVDTAQRAQSLGLWLPGQA